MALWFMMQLMPSCFTHMTRFLRQENFLQAGIPIYSQVNIQDRENMLPNYLDRQLLKLINFGFLLDFNLYLTGNHCSANTFPHDIKAYIAEELSYRAFLGPFPSTFIPGDYYSPFMTRKKPNSNRCCVIMDLIWNQWPQLMQA